MDGIAIVGLAGRFPGAPNIPRFWHTLRHGQDTVTTLSETDLRAAGVPPSLYEDPAYVRARGVLEDADLFDASFFGCTPREAALMDPQHRIFLRCAHEALEDAGYDPQRFDGAIGVYAGASLNTYLLANLCHDRAWIDTFTRAFQTGSYDVLLGNDKDYLATRVAFRLGLRGPALTIQTACSTSLVAIITACQGLLSWQCDLALAGGVSVSFPQHRGYRHEEGGIGSRDGRCRPFDAASSGTVFGAGVGVVALKRLSEALADGDDVHCVIRGFGLNNDGAAKVSYMAPSAAGQAEAIAMAHAMAGVTADTITYVEAHGTGTPVGDPIEIAGLTHAFRATTDKTGFCAIGSVKANVGHLEAAAGVTGLIKTALMLRHRTLVPTPHFVSANPQIDFARTPFRVQTRCEPWRCTGDTPLRAGVSAFGVGGTNAHVVLESAPVAAPARVPSSGTRNGSAPAAQVLVLSARTQTALEAAATRLADDLERLPDRPLADVAWTLQTGRTVLPHRLAVTCENAAEGAAVLRAGTPTRRAEDTDVPVAFLFPGQGAQQIGMLAAAYTHEPGFRAEVDACCDLLAPHLGLDLRTLLYPTPDTRDEAEARLRQTAITQPALFVIEYALARLWMSWGVTPAALLGHSVGEYVAACLAGLFSRDDALALVAARGRLMQALPPGAMLAVRCGEAALQPYLDDTVTLAAVNAPTSCVAAGPVDAIEQLRARLAERQIASRVLATSHAFHSPMMDAIEADFLQRVADVTRSVPHMTWISNLTGTPVTVDEARDPAYWFRHLRHAVRFSDGLETLLRTRPLVLLEVGPGQTLCGLARQHPARRPEHAVQASAPNGDAPVRDALGALWTAGAAVQWDAVHGGVPRRRVSLPTYPFEEERHWIAPPPASSGDAAPSPVAAEGATEQAPAPRTDTAALPADGWLERVLALLENLSGLTAIDPHTRFFDLGFDSLFLTQTVAEIRTKLGVHVPFRALLENLTTPAQLAAHLARQRAEAGETPPAPETVGPRLRLSRAQREIWLACQMSPEASRAYHESYTLRLRGRLDVDALRAAITDLVTTHEALRIVIAEDGETQEVKPPAPAEVPLTDLSDARAETRDRSLAAVIETEAGAPFDLARGPLARFRLVRAAADDHHLIVTAHHGVCDGWSFDVLLADLGALYTARAEGRTCTLTRPAFRNHLAWAGAEQARRDNDARWWEERFTPPPSPLEIPHDRPRPSLRAYAAGTRVRILDAALTEQVKRAAAAEGVTLFVWLMATWQAWLHRASSQEDLVVGFPVAGQMLSGQEQLVGQCANLLPLRCGVGADMTFRALLAEVRTAVLDACAHPHVSFGELVSRLPLARDPGRAPLVSVHLNLDRRPQALSYLDLAASVRVNPRAAYTFDLGLNVEERDDTLIVHAFHNLALLSPQHVDALLESWQALIASAVRDAGQRLDHLPMMTPAQERRLLLATHGARRATSGRRTLATLFEARADERPDAVAVRVDDRRITYRDLNERANRLAHHLRRRGVACGANVAVLLDAPLAQVVAALAIVKAGAAYVPLDSAAPAERLAFMLTDCHPAGLISTTSHSSRLAAFGLPRTESPGGLETVLLDADETRIHGESSVNPAPTAEPHDIAYVIYTSGSTGRPKGVEVPHAAAAGFLDAMREAEWLGPSDVVLATCAFTFDVHLADRWLPLVSGVPVVLASRETVTDGVRLVGALEATGATAICTTPGVLRMMLEGGWQRRRRLRIICGGDVMPPELAREVLARADLLWNAYGPTETTVIATAFPVEAPVEGPIPIGRPLANTRIYVLDAAGRPLPPGFVGELCIGGEGLARGYLDRPTLTAERFVPNPLADRETALGLTPSPRLYRSGDMVRMRPDGNLEFVGRRDFQVKIRGVRIELEEIEAILDTYPEVCSSAVAVHRDEVRGPSLVAFVATPAPGPSEEALRAHLRRALPDSMIPSAFHRLDALPLSSSGKIDRATLERLAVSLSVSRAAPQRAAHALEHIVMRIWSEVLGRPVDGLHDDFFALGGHSLLAMRVVARLQETIGARLGAQAVFEASTPTRLADMVTAHLHASTAGREVMALLDSLRGAPQDELERLLADLWQTA